MCAVVASGYVAMVGTWFETPLAWHRDSCTTAFITYVTFVDDTDTFFGKICTCCYWWWCMQWEDIGDAATTADGVGLTLDEHGHLTHHERGYGY